MTVHVRGYRAYEGEFERPGAVLAIAGESFRRASRRKTFKRIAIFYVVWFAICMFWLYVAVGTDLGVALRFAQHGPRAEAVQELSQAAWSLRMLSMTLLSFSWGASILTALLAVFVGSGLISDDLAAGALPLYRVRPISAADYVMGKALVLPAILFFAMAVPGILMVLLVGLWQPPGETWAFLSGNLAVVGRILESFLIAAASYTGLSLFLSSRSPRHAAVAVTMGIILFAGFLLGILVRTGTIGGAMGDVFLLSDLMGDIRVPFEYGAREVAQRARWSLLPSRTAVLAVAGTVLAVGWIAALRRTRSVEVTS